MKPQIVLASTSPFRKRLMERLNIKFLSATPLCDEEALKKTYSGPVEGLCAYLAQAKSESLSHEYKNALIIGSDQSLFCDGRTLGKGHDFDGAFKQLKFCSSKTAKLITSVYIEDTSGESLSFENITTLHFKNLNDAEITNYLKWDEPYKCAGSFKFESKGSFLFEKIECTDPSAIEGLPMMDLAQKLKSKGVTFAF